MNRPQEKKSSSAAEKTEVVYGQAQVVNAIIAWQYNAKKVWNLCVNSRVPQFSMSSEIKLGFIDAKARGVNIRYITEITKENLNFCKEVMKVAQVRHLDGVVGNFVVSEKEYVGEVMDKHFLTRSLYSNKKEIVHQLNCIFENLWNNSIVAQKRILEIEETKIPIETKIIENNDSIVSKVNTEISNSNEIMACSRQGRLEFIYNTFFDLYKEVVIRQARGEHKGIRLIVTIDKNSVELVKKFLSAGIQVRHVKNLLPISFVVTDKEIQLSLEDIKGRQMIQSLLTSNEPLYVKQFASVFEQLWKDGIGAELRIKDLEEGIENEIEVIQNPAKALELYIDILKNVQEEILLIYPSTNAVVSQEKASMFDYLRGATKNQNVYTRILLPSKASTNSSIQDLIKKNRRIEIRYIEQISSRAIILITDKKNSLVMELKDDSKKTFSESIGLSTYSSSKAGVLSYVAIFENLWTQTELLARVKAHDRIQNEFINIAAHELRTPVQPILSLTESLRSDITTVEGRKLLDIVIRNAERLEQLAEDILDVTRIEGKTFHLNLETFNLNDLVEGIVMGFRGEIKRKARDIEIIYDNSIDGPNIEADKARISQVISNLLANAIRFTKHGNIILCIQELSDKVIVSVKDTGEGIDPEIVPRLFTKFASKSLTGTGLGLFISKNIVEGHGGLIVAENNKDERGAKFSFSLPLKAKL